MHKPGPLPLFGMNLPRDDVAANCVVCSRIMYPRGVLVFNEVSEKAPSKCGVLDFVVDVIVADVSIVVVVAEVHQHLRRTNVDVAVKNVIAEAHTTVLSNKVLRNGHRINIDVVTLVSCCSVNKLGES